MNPKTTIIAAVLLAALGAYIYFYEREPVDTSSSDQEKVFDLKADDVQHIEIRPAEGVPVELTKDGETWKIVKPVEAPADETEVESLARHIAELERQRYVAEADPIRLEDFGLDEPAVEVEFKAKKTQETKGFILGDETPTGTNRYAKLLRENKVFVISSYLKGDFDKTAWDLRDKKVLHFDTDDVERVTLKRPDGELALAKAGEDLWNVTTPSFCRADRYKASSLASRFQSAKMEKIISESESTEKWARYGLNPPHYEVEIQLKGGKSVRLQVGEAKGDKFYARDADRSVVFLVDKSLVEDIKKDPSEVRSKRLFEYATYQVNKFQIAPAGAPARVYEKTEAKAKDEQAKWTQTAPERHEWDRTKVEDLLYKMNGTDAEGFAEDTPKDLAPYGLDPPAVAITVWSKQDKTLEEVRVGKPEGEWVYARRKGDEPVLKLKASVWEEIEKLMRFEEDEKEKGEKEESAGQEEK